MSLCLLVTGCSVTSNLFYDYTEMFRNGVSLSGIPWLLEWYMLLKYMRPPEVLQQALKDLFRFQKFEELGMTHTCRNKHTDSCFDYNKGFHPPREDEIWGMTIKLEADETEDDIQEIINEEEEFVDLLQGACIDFEKLSDKSDENKWISILGRRAVFIEEANRKIVDRNTSQRTHHSAQNHLEELKVCISLGK